jgi:hypothetical protein
VGQATYPEPTWTGSTGFLQTGGACKGGHADAQFPTQVHVTVDGVVYGWLASDGKSAPNRCLY